jgi:protein-S-isoprenylcysteine O-methyltransferase Ste14
VVAGAVPALIVAGEGEVRFGWLSVLGAALLAAGLTLIATTIRLFATVGRGTLAPWDPPQRLVVAGPYRRFRHPMITGVVCTIFGEAALFGSGSVALWGVAVVAVNAVYLPLVEEPDLVDRFGADYERYMREVPRWLPARRPHGS